MIKTWQLPLLQIQYFKVDWIPEVEPPVSKEEHTHGMHLSMLSCVSISASPTAVYSLPTIAAASQSWPLEFCRATVTLLSCAHGSFTLVLLTGWQLPLAMLIMSS